jgi:serine/threonine-protein kinase
MSQKLVGDVRSIRELRPEADEALEAVLARALEAAPEDRFATAGEFGEALRSPEVGWTIAAKRLKARRRRVVAATAAGLVVLVLAVGAVLQYVRGQAEPTRLVVLPFENLGAAEDEYFADGITEEIRNRLGAVGALQVKGRRSARVYEDTDKTIEEIGEELDVDYLVDGTVRQQGGEGRVRITAELIRVSDATSVWNDRYSALGLQDIFQAQIDVAQSIVEALQLRLTGQEAEVLERRYTQDREAYQLYLWGRHLGAWASSADWPKAIEYFEQAIARDSTFAPAYAGLSGAYARLAYVVPPREAFPKARAAAETALRIEETLAEAHAALGTVSFAFDWDWHAADREFSRALELNPGSAMAHREYAYYLIAMGRYDQAVAAARRHQELDPLAPDADAWLGVIYRAVGRYEEAISSLERALELYPGNGWAAAQLASVYGSNGMFPEAIAQAEGAEELTRSDPTMWPLVAIAYATAGRTSDARRILDELRELGTERYFEAAAFAGIYEALGETEEAIVWYRRAFDERSPDLPGVANAFQEPWRSLRSDPRYQELVARMNFPN